MRLMHPKQPVEQYSAHVPIQLALVCHVISHGSILVLWMVDVCTRRRQISYLELFQVCKYLCQSTPGPYGRLFRELKEPGSIPFTHGPADLEWTQSRGTRDIDTNFSRVNPFQKSQKDGEPAKQNAFQCWNVVSNIYIAASKNRAPQKHTTHVQL